MEGTTHNLYYYKETPSCTAYSTDFLPDELDSFHARFELRHTNLLERTSTTEDTASALVIQRRMCVWYSNASTSAKRPGRMGYQAGCSKHVRTSWLVYSNIFNLSLSTCIVPTIKSSVIIPVPKKS